MRATILSELEQETTRSVADSLRGRWLGTVTCFPYWLYDGSARAQSIVHLCSSPVGTFSTSSPLESPVSIRRLFQHFLPCPSLLVSRGPAAVPCLEIPPVLASTRPVSTTKRPRPDQQWITRENDAGFIRLPQRRPLNTRISSTPASSWISSLRTREGQ